MKSILVSSLLGLAFMAGCTPRPATPAPGTGSTSTADAIKISKAVKDLNNFKTLLEVLKHDIGRFPTTKEGLDALRQEPSGVGNWKGPYLTRSAPLDPWLNEYEYSSTDGGKTFHLLCLGADGKPGGVRFDSDFGVADY